MFKRGFNMLDKTAMGSKVRINISGTVFEFCRDILGRGGRLAEICRGQGSTDNVLEVSEGRSASCFEAVLSYYQTGRLHIPYTVCPGFFKEELDYWKIDVDVLSECCMFRYNTGMLYFLYFLF